MEEVLMWVALAILLGLLVVGVQALGHGGQAVLIKTEFVAYGLTRFGVTDPTVAWLVLGILVGGAVGFAVGFGRAGRKVEMAFACVTTPALLVLLSVLSVSAPKPERITSSNNKTDQPSKPLAEALNSTQPSNKLHPRPLPRRLSQPLAEALNRAKVVSGRALETVTVIAPADGNWIKVCGYMYIYPRSASIYLGTDGGDEYFFRPAQEIVGLPPSRCLAFRSAGVKPVKVKVHFPD
jgi:hypothetical protein